jgi:ribosomal protein S18 acetylase RimI-like enzyme
MTHCARDADVGPRVRLRASTEDDRRFLRDVYAGTRADELALLDWTDAQKQAFVEMQFDAQDRHYRDQYRTATFDVIVVDGEEVGRLYVDRWPGEIRVVDLALLPAHRNRGIGGTLLRELVHEAASSSRKLSIHVERHNPAIRLYRRHGFVQVAERGVHLLMERAPGQDQPAPGSGDDRLVAHAKVVGTERHQEERELAEVGVGHGAGLLVDDGIDRPVEEQRERDTPTRPVLIDGRTEPGLLAGREHQVGGLASCGHHPEHLAHQRGEGGAGEPLEHEGQATPPEDRPMAPLRSQNRSAR